MPTRAQVELLEQAERNEDVGKRGTWVTFTVPTVKVCVRKGWLRVENAIVDIEWVRITPAGREALSKWRGAHAP